MLPCHFKGVRLLVVRESPEISLYQTTVGPLAGQFVVFFQRRCDQ